MKFPAVCYIYVKIYIFTQFPDTWNLHLFKFYDRCSAYKL